MRLIISEYLSLLKESGELDQLLPDLLLSMSAETISHPQKGVRQFGVDAAAISDFEDGVKTLYLFVIKQGDIGRKDWDGEQQSIRQSLDEIKDVYLTSHIRQEHQQLRKKVIVCSGGKLKQEIQQNWKGYTDSNTSPDKIEYDFWGGDRLSLLIEQYMFDSNLLPIELQSKIRKTLALLGDSDYELIDFYSLIDELLLNSSLEKKSIKSIEKTLRTIHLCLNVVFHWSRQENNLKPSIFCAEKTLLSTWEFIGKNSLCSKKSVLLIYFDVLKTAFSIYTEYFNKLQDHCYVSDGLSGYGRNFILESLNIFEVLGITSVAGLLYAYQSILENNKSLHDGSLAIAETVCALIDNNPITNTPCYDSHIIEICAAIHLLVFADKIEFIDSWIKDIANHVSFAYCHMNRNFPIQSDSFDDAVALNISGSIPKEKMFEMSTLVPILAQWCATLDLEESYNLIRDISRKAFPNCVLQIWYPCKESDQHLYTQNAAYKSGACDAPINLPDSLNEMKSMMEEVQQNTIIPADISSIKHGLSILPIIASRHFRTPFLPLYWQGPFIKQVDTNDQNQ